jgi:nucleotide-binding universal stress UspA family protein
MLSDGPILAGYDGFDSSRDGLELTRLLAVSLDRSIEILSVLTYLPDVSLDEYELMLARDERRLAEEARAALEGVSVHTLMIPSGSPTRELHDVAEAHGSALIAIGSTHRGALGRLLPGTTADRLLTAAPCPVAVAPRGYRHAHPSLERILVAFDGSVEAKEALATGTRLATGVGASIELLAVADLRSTLTVAAGWGGGSTVRALIDQQVKATQSVVDEAISAGPEGVAMSGRVAADSDPATVIAQRSADADLLVIGSRGYGPLGRVLLGSVSSGLLRTAACPVIVTPRSAVAD